MWVQEAVTFKFTLFVFCEPVSAFWSWVGCVLLCFVLFFPLVVWLMGIFLCCLCVFWDEEYLKIIRMGVKRLKYCQDGGTVHSHSLTLCELSIPKLRDYVFHSLASLQKNDLDMLEGSMEKCRKWKQAQKPQRIALPVKAMFCTLMFLVIVAACLALITLL